MFQVLSQIHPLTHLNAPALQEGAVCYFPDDKTGLERLNNVPPGNI